MPQQAAGLAQLQPGSSPPTALCHWERGLPCPLGGSGCPGRTQPRPWRLGGNRSAAPSSPVEQRQRQTGGGERRQGRGGRLRCLPNDLRGLPLWEAVNEGRPSCLGAQPIQCGLKGGLQRFRWL